MLFKQNKNINVNVRDKSLIIIHITGNYTITQE